MDADEFARCERPASVRSRMAPFLGQLLKLRGGGYTLAQLQDFLRRNGVSVSVAGVSSYLIRSRSVPSQEPPSGGRKPPNAALAPEATSTDSKGLQELLRTPPSDLDSLTRQGRRMKPK